MHVFVLHKNLIILLENVFLFLVSFAHHHGLAKNRNYFFFFKFLLYCKGKF